MKNEIKTENLSCPFCGEDEYGFDFAGLKYHLLRYCEVFENTESL